MDRNELTELIQGIIDDRGVPRRIKDTLSESLPLLERAQLWEENIAHLISLLDDVSANPNLSMTARTHIWNIVSALEQERNRK